MPTLQHQTFCVTAVALFGSLTFQQIFAILASLKGHQKAYPSPLSKSNLTDYTELQGVSAWARGWQDYHQA